MFLYNTGIFLYTCAIYISSLFKPKAKLWVNGRKQWRERLTSQLQKLPNKKRIWIHCASLGEFEQGRPVIEALKKQSPDTLIILTFFSPSGFEIRKDYEYADLVCYLPPDFKKNAVDFIESCNPHTVIFVKYEFWLNYLFTLHHKKIPTYLISAVIKTHQPFFKWYGNVFLKALKTYKNIFVQDKESLDLLKELGVNSGILCGDTRVDRVLQGVNTASEIEKLKSFCGTNLCLIAGSTWERDDQILIDSYLQFLTLFPNLKLIIAPHETDEASIKSLINKLELKRINYTLYLNQTDNSAHVLVINTIGVLASAYKYGHVAFIGGGFNNGIHNILEPAAHKLPVIFGPNHQKFNEAKEFIKNGAGFEVSNTEELTSVVKQLFNSSSNLETAANAAYNYLEKNSGATLKILDKVLSIQVSAYQ